jgi:subtilase family serine protease
MHHRRRTTIVAAVGVATATFAATALAASGVASAAPIQGAAGSGRVVIANTGLGGATNSATPMAGTAKVGVSVFVGRDAAGLRALAAQISDPSSSLYRHFLSQGQIQARFGATAAEQAGVVSWLRGAGFTVTHQDSTVVSAMGTAAKAQAALDSPVDSVSGLGTIKVMPARDVSVPASLGAFVNNVILRGATVPKAFQQKLPKTDPVVPGSAQAKAITEKCSKYYGQKRADGTPKAFGAVYTWAPCGYVPSQVRAAYGVTAAGFTGKGETVGIISGDNDSTGEADADQYSVNRGEPQFAKGQYKAIIGSGAYPGIGDVESALDIEAVHGMAPDADVVYSAGGGSITGDSLLDAYVQLVQDKDVDVITSSWYEGYIGGVPQSLIDQWEQYLATSATEGQTVDFATGDYSDTTPLQYPGSDPAITTVGGTSLAIGKNKSNLWEAPWATDEANLSGSSWSPTPPGNYAEGGTGGISTVFKEPSWQKGVVSSTVDPTNMRAVPDVSALGDWNLGYQIGFTPNAGGQYEEAVNGGTSLSSPLFTGMLADAIQGDGGTNLGFANPTFYALYKSPAFHDVIQTPLGAKHTLAVVYGPSYGQPPTLSTMAQCQSTVALVCGRGYDTVAGLGSPTVNFFSAFDK